MTTTDQALQAIETAIQIEKDGLAFYSEAARQTSDPAGRRMFETLARDETAHLRLFESVKASLLEEKGWPTPEQVAALNPARRLPVFPPVKAGQPLELPQRELAALQRGLRAEEESIDFYTRQMEAAQDADARAMYAYLVEQEQGHRTILQGEYDYMTQTGFWFDAREFTLESM